MVSSVARGNRYKAKTKQWFIKNGYIVELTEFTAVRFIGKGKQIYVKKDILASDGIAYNDKEFILWNSKSVIKDQYVAREKSQGLKEYREIKTPPYIKKQLIIWKLRAKEPIVIDCG